MEKIIEKKLTPREENIKELQSKTKEQQLNIYKNIVPINSKVLLVPLVMNDFEGSIHLPHAQAQELAAEREYSEAAQVVVSVDPEIYTKFKIDIKTGDKVLGAKKVIQVKLNGYFIDQVSVHDLDLIIKDA